MKTNKPSRIKKSAVTAIKVLVAIADGIDLLNMSRSHQSILIREGWSGLKRLRLGEEQRAIALRIAYLKRKKLIQEKKFGERVSYAATDMGRIKLIREFCKYASNHPVGTHTIVIYDIPESQRRARSLFRRFLKTNNFVLCQRSVWISDRDVAKPLSDFIKVHKLSPWIQIFVAKEFKVPQ
jgi:DNA-binding transcriptional regulator PaaX